MTYPPKLPGNLLFGNTLQYAKDPLTFYMDNMHQYKDIVHIKLASNDYYVVYEPYMVKHVLQANNKNYRKADSYKPLRMFLGNGLLHNEGESWRKHRKISQPAFHKEKLSALAGTMQTESQKMIEKWKAMDAGKPVNISMEMMEITAEIVAKAIFSTDVHGYTNTIHASIVAGMSFATKRLSSMIKWPLYIPVPMNVNMKKAHRNLESIIFKFVNERKKNGESKNDLLDMLLNARYEDTGEPLSSTQLRDELMTLFGAGHETSANALTWTMYLLEKNPDKLRLLQQEVDEVLAGRVPALDMLPQMQYTYQVILESMRLMPPAWQIGRKAIYDDHLGDYRVPKDYNIFIPVYAIHRNPEYWKNPDEFEPDRFLPENEEARPSYTYIPFGGGPRMCIGSNFAMMEMQIILPMIVRHFTWKLADDTCIESEPLITLRPKYGMAMHLHQR